MSQTTIAVSKTRKKVLLKRNIPLLLLALPALVYVFIFNYLPMFGVVIAFKDYKYSKGIFGSEWCGWDNFEAFFKSNDVFSVIKNTLGYSLEMLFLQVLLSIVIALLLYEITKKLWIKTYQTAILIPNFISWVLVSYIVFALLSHEYGIVNRIIEWFGGEAIQWYDTPIYWQFILPIVYLWKACGHACILYYAALMGMDPSLYEAADIDGAGRWDKLIHITLPELAPIICTVLILGVGSAMSGNFGLFYQVPRQSAALYSTTDIISTYVYRTLQEGNIGVSAAVGLFQSVAGTVLVLLANMSVKKINPDSAMF